MTSVTDPRAADPPTGTAAGQPSQLSQLSQPTPQRPPSRADAMAAHASGFLGGPWGRHAGVRRWSWWTPLRILLAMTCFTLLLGFAQKSPCATGNWSGEKQYTHMCYSDIVPLWSAERLDTGAVPYRDTAVEYPVLTGAFMWVSADLTRGVHALHDHWTELVIFASITALLLSICALVVTASTVACSRGRPYDAALFALSPMLVFQAFSNWDLLAMAFASGALWAWARRRPVLAGVLIGLGTAAKLYPALLLIPILILAVRTRRWSSALWTCAAAALAWLAVNVPVALAYYPGWSTFYLFNTDRAAERETLWAMARTLATASFADNDAASWSPPNIATTGALLIALAAVVWIGLKAPVKPRLAQLAFLVVLAFLITSKVWNAQYSLWLLPLLALARPRWRLALAWQFTEILGWFLKLTLLHGVDQAINNDPNNRGIAYGWLALVLLARDVLLVIIAVYIVRDMWHPELDVVRTGGLDDPGGGEFDEARDYRSRTRPTERALHLAAAPTGWTST